jgi:hypothetical protein
MVSSVLGEAPRFLYVRDVSQVRAWVPGVPGIAEAFHARFTDHGCHSTCRPPPCFAAASVYRTSFGRPTPTTRGR